MSDASLTDLGAAAVAAQAAASPMDERAEDRMHLVRELLYGEFRRETDARVAMLESRVRELESGLHRRLDLIQARIDALSGEISADRRGAFDELARHVLDLGDRIRRINKV